MYLVDKRTPKARPLGTCKRGEVISWGAGRILAMVLQLDAASLHALPSAPRCLHVVILTGSETGHLHQLNLDELVTVHTAQLVIE